MHPNRRHALQRVIGLAVAGPAMGVLATQPRASSGRTGHEPLQAPASWNAALDSSDRTGRPIVLMFSRPGCPHCVALRLDSLGHLQAEADERGVLVYELDLTDDQPFGASDAPARAGANAASPAALARTLNVSVSPTVLFLGPDGELAERLVGYASADFYNAYLHARIEQSRATLARR
jgi:thiol-disulfide isomerase/thioredoxin